MPVILPNATEMDTDPFEVPLKDDGSPYRFEMLFNGLVDRGYGDTAAELLAMLVRGYDRMTETERMASRLMHAVRVQAIQQANINHTHDFLRRCTPEQQVILSSSRATPPEVLGWGSEVPLLLVNVFYHPIGKLPAPISTIADVADPPNLIWLRPDDEYEYLLSLVRSGYIDLHEHEEFTA